MFQKRVQLVKSLINRPGKNTHWVKDLNIQDQKDLSSYYCKTKKVPLDPKRFKLSYHHDGIDDYDQKEMSPKRVKLSYLHDGIDDYGQIEKEEYKAYGITKQVEKANNNEKENNNKKK